MVKIETRDRTLFIRLPEDATIAAVTGDLGKLRSALDVEDFNEILVSAAEVETVDTAYLQLLCSLNRTAAAKGKGIRYIEITQPVAEITGLYGLTLDCSR